MLNIKVFVNYFCNYFYYFFTVCAAGLWFVYSERMQNEKILAYLEGSCFGKANRASGTELERTLHISGTCLRKQVNRLRCKEHPIASDRSGYFYATNAGEVYDTIRQLKQMVSGLEAAISGLERSMERFRERGEAGHG